MLKVGFIGLGNMGGAVARNIQRAGYELTVHDLRPEAGKRLIEHGAHWASTPADTLNQVDVVVTMVFGPKEVEQVLRGERGLLAANCQGKIWIDSTTSSPALMRELAAEFGQAGGLPVDAPVTGSVDAAIRGDMIMFVGGADTAVAQARPILEAMGQIRLVGQYGNGYVANLVRHNHHVGRFAGGG